MARIYAERISDNQFLINNIKNKHDIKNKLFCIVTNLREFCIINFLLSFILKVFLLVFFLF